MNNSKVLGILLASIFTTNIILAQNSTNKQSVKNHNKAIDYFNIKEFKQALEYNEKALKNDTNFADSWLLKGEIMLELDSLNKAIEAYNKVIEINSTDYQKVFYILGNIYFDMENYQKAIEMYHKYLNTNSNDSLLLSKIATVEFRLEKINLAEKVNFENIGPHINSSGYDFINYISPDSRTIYFTRRYIDGDKRDEDFYFSNKNENDVFSLAQPFDYPINTMYDEGAMAISSDQKLMIFAGCNRPEGYGSCDLYYSKFIDGKWTTPKNIGGVVNSKYWESQPCLAIDNKTLYFASNRNGGYGGSDIWLTQFDEQMNFTEPINLGNVINTKADEKAPFIHFDLKTLYFSSNGHRGLGKSDIFKSTLSNNQWTIPQNLGYPINSINDESNIIIDNLGKYAYVSSSNKGGYGLQDIYRFELPHHLRPNAVIYMKGTVYDSVTMLKLEANISLINLFNGEVVNKIKANKSGEFMFCITSNENYAIVSEHKGYLNYSLNIDLRGKNNSIEKPYFVDIKLKPIVKGEHIILRNIFFKTDSSNLLPESKHELIKLIDFLKFNKNIKIEISGHTDSSGDTKYNEILSLKRAESVYNYLIENGIEHKRLIYSGYGDKYPIDSNDTEQGKAANRRTEMKIIDII